MRHHRFYGYGPGYCYYGQHRALVVIADSLETARAMAAPRARLRAERPYPPDPEHKVFIFSIAQPRLA